MIRRYRRNLSALRVPVALLAVVGDGMANAAWNVVPEVSVSVEQVDNIRLTPVSERESKGTRSVVDARVDLTLVGDRGFLMARPRIIADRYAQTEHQARETNDLFLRSSGEYDWRLVRAGFWSDYRKEELRTSLLLDALPDDPDIEEPPDTDTGRIFTAQQREQLVIQPWAEFVLTPRNSIRIESYNTEVTYELAEPTGRSNFVNTSVSVALVRHVAENREVSARITASRYEAEANDNKTDSVGMEGVFSQSLSETWGFDLVAGVSRYDYSFQENNSLVQNADTAFNFRLRLRRRTELTSLNIDFDRLTLPSGSGFLVNRTQFRLSLRRWINDRLSVNGAVYLFDSSSLDQVITRDDREYARFQFRLDWVLATRLILSGTYKYTRQEFVNDGRGPASANGVLVSIRYRGLGRF